MNPGSTPRLLAATASGSPALSVVDFSTGGLLVEAPIPFDIGTVVHLRLSSFDGASCGTFALRCLHAHRTAGIDRETAHLSALVFVDPLDVRTRALLAGSGHDDVKQDHFGDSGRILRFSSLPSE